MVMSLTQLDKGKKNRSVCVTGKTNIQIIQQAMYKEEEEDKGE